MLRYEDMQRDLGTQALRIGTFLDRSITPQAASAIARHGSFKNMSANPFTNREGDPVMDFSIARFLRKGIVGDWENYFTENQMKRFDEEWDRKMGGLDNTISPNIHK